MTIRESFNEDAKDYVSRKEYCTQNDGDCSTCSLVNYGRDCRNNPIDEPAPEPVEIKKLSESIFRFEMLRAESMKCIDSGSIDSAFYWAGYMRGLRYAFHDSFGTEQEHQKHLSLIGDRDLTRDARGRGYRAGLQGRPDAEILISD